MSLEEAASERVVRPLGLYHWGRVWTLIAWCELRADFRTFRIDRIGAAEDAGPFRHEPGRTLRDYLRRLAATEAIPAAFRDQPGARV